ncbi:hypothetical protein DH2020_036922 [Rehmannia glutinosa]|uniref:UspA domain-containing protein n=1 Tax=Rehmannia glutinosa TaxID=99300 RepID=A0ABR0V4I1_REHGL
MAVRGGEIEPTRIMVAVNESKTNGYPHASESCTAAFEWTLKTIVRNNASRLKILLIHVQIPDEDGGSDHVIVDNIYSSPEDFKHMKRRDLFGAIRLLGYFMKQCQDVGVACEAYLKEGVPKKIICCEANDARPDLLVVGSRGLSLSTFRKIFIGSVGEYCLKHADCPVIVIKHSPPETPQSTLDDSTTL